MNGAPSFAELWEQVRRAWDEGAGAPLPPDVFRPVLPWTQGAVARPIIAALGLVGLAIAAGISLAALGTLLVAMLAAHWLLTEVFGISIEIDPAAI